MIKKIGFENFRRFHRFPMIELGDVTILVGGNNSGKSTLVKALLLCLDNLKLMRVSDNERNLFSQYPIFRFDANEFHDAKVKTFDRAILHDILTYRHNNGQYYPYLPKSITFRIGFDHFEFDILISEDSTENSTDGIVEKIVIYDSNLGLEFQNDFSNGSMSCTQVDATVTQSMLDEGKLYQNLLDIQKLLDEATRKEDLKEIANLSAERDKIIKAYRENIDKGVVVPDNYEELEKLYSNYEDKLRNGFSLEFPLERYINNPFELVVSNVINNIIHYISKNPEDKPKEEDYDNHEEYEVDLFMYEDKLSHIKALRQEKEKIKRSRIQLQMFLEEVDVHYISAHAANQNTLYSTSDRNDYIARVVHEYYREKINRGDKIHSFITKWMSKFEIGNDFEIVSLIPGEAYRLDIQTNKYITIPLSDQGMGAIQIMIMLLRLATILNRCKNRTSSTTIIIEEPEQNLHPKMQSLLADLFAELAKDGKCQFIIETHSEYLVRKTQVLVAKENYENEDEMKENNPFKVYYLPTGDEAPYQMEYRTDGRFSNEFNTGFFDTAANLAFELI